MKITNADVIKSGEKDLIDSITADLDWGAIENIFLTEHNLGIDEDIEYKKGDIIAYNNQVAYQLEFTVKVNLSVLINREGEYLSVKISEKNDHKEIENINEDVNEPDAKDSVEKDMIQNNENQVSGTQDLSEAVIEKKEDKYIEALEQLGSNDSGEGAGDLIN